MAKFVLAGKADCPHYAKAELLADRLQRSLPNFNIHTISILPHEWQEWLDATCRSNGWKHQQSPLVWRELVAQGGKGLLLGGFSDFLKHCQNYYGITSDMPVDIMLSVAAENLETKLSLIKEEQLRISLIKPLHIWISSALSPTCHFLIPNLLSAEVFPHIPAISLHLLHLEGDMEELQWLKTETEELALSLLHQVSVHTDLEDAFQGAKVILLLDERDGGDADEHTEGIAARYREYGRLIDTRASKEVKVMVSGDSLINMKCSLLLDTARSIDKHQFVAVATQLENEARAVVAKKLKVRTSDVTDVIVWGNISGSFYADLQRAKVYNYDGAIKGPAFFSQPALNFLHDRKWLEMDFQELVRCRRAAVWSKTGRAAAMSSANGILSVLKAWNGGLEEVCSMGVQCQGCYQLPDAIVLSVPVCFSRGKWSTPSDVAVGDKLKERLQLFAGELKQETVRGSQKVQINNADI